ncbi:MAG: YebC/PmpR family DNA-binding transcriptional regulator [Patescibacteria group bacterium]
MSGHSKWSTIKRQKEVNDAKKGAIFTKLAKAISLASRDGGADPNMNMKLRFAVEKAKQSNMPKENIERAVASAQGKLDNLVELTYEGYGPSGVPVIVEAATDNKNRTAQEIKNLFERGGGTLATPGSVSFQFERAGQLVVDKSVDPEKRMLELIDLGVEDIEEADDGIEVYIKPAELFLTKQKLEVAGMTVKSSELIYRPKVNIEVRDGVLAQKVVKLLETLDDHDDVQRVYAGVDIVFPL